MAEPKETKATLNTLQNYNTDDYSEPIPVPPIVESYQIEGTITWVDNSDKLGINKEKLDQFDDIIDSKHLIGDKFIVAQRGKKNYFLLIAE